MNSKFLLMLGALFVLFFSGAPVNTVEGYKPIYVPADEAKTIKTLAPREVETQGKIYLKDQYIYIGDVNLGVHVIDNSDPYSPQPIAFIQIYGNHDISIKENVLYADNLDDLVVIDISDLNNPVELKRIEKVYEMPNQSYPENLAWRTYFECADPAKGLIVGWVPATIESPECYTSY